METESDRCGRDDWRIRRQVAEVLVRIYFLSAAQSSRADGDEVREYNGVAVGLVKPVTSNVICSDEQKCTGNSETTRKVTDRHSM